jgi:hypothetical protein
MSTWVGMGPVIGPGSLDGFAVGVMMSGAVFLTLTAPRRARRQPAMAAGTTGMLTAGRDWLSRRPRMPRIPRLPGSPRVSEIPKQSGISGLPEVPGARALGADAFEPGAFEAGAFGPSPFGAGPFAPGAERLAQPDEPGSYSDTGWHLTVGDDGRAAGGRRSRHRLNEPLPGTTSPDRAPRGGTSREGGHCGSATPGGTRRSSGGFPDSAFPDDDAFPDVRFPDVEFPGEEPRDAEWLDPLPDLAPRDSGQLDALRGTAPSDAGRLEPLPDMAPRDRARRESPFPDWASRDDSLFPNGASRDRGRPDVEFPDVAFPDGTFGTSKRPDARRLPRHAAPAVGLSSKVSRWMTGLFARPATSGARG